jgi:hypothetical protein
VPVLVRVSYFPNWQVTGADGPYRVAPNLMIVVPTDTEVHLTYERSGLDITAYVLTILGIVMLIVWRRRGDVTFPFERPRFGDATYTTDPVNPTDASDPSDRGDSFRARGGSEVRDHVEADPNDRWRARHEDPTTPMTESALDIELRRATREGDPPRPDGSDEPGRL